MFLLSCLFLCLNVRKQKKIDCPPKKENVPHNFSKLKGTNLSPSCQILAQTLHNENEKKLSLEIKLIHL